MRPAAWIAAMPSAQSSSSRNSARPASSRPAGVRGSPASVPELLKVTRKKVERWAPLLARFLKSEDDQVEMLLTLEDYCSEETVFTGMGGSALTPAFPKILHMLYDMDVLSEVSVLAWSAEKEGAEEEDKKFLKLAKPFVEWLKRTKRARRRPKRRVIVSRGSIHQRVSLKYTHIAPITSGLALPPLPRCGRWKLLCLP